MSMQYKLTFLPDGDLAENVTLATVAEGSKHPFLSVIDGMIASGGFKFDDDIEDWQGFPDGEGFAKPHQAAQFLSVTKDVAKSEQVVFPKMFRALDLLNKAASGRGQIYVSYF
ncbi:hypothetical protein [uncultured Tateyamaria sp.]|uniref:hypothetical protein n=1 Tax=uncultured Tateyamaria sp. TaxID=455651 RepID=UPI00262449C2|nr:hypothetical protein [uncultured Tateyamaria sp.]